MNAFNAAAALGGLVICLASANASEMHARAPRKPGDPGAIRPNTCAAPKYPKMVLTHGEHGLVTLRFLINKDGTVKKVVVIESSGHNALDEAALFAMSKCLFRPYMADGTPVEGWTTVKFVWAPEF